ncbi:MAG TPA: hypothetical protein VH107_19100 [Lacipirellulaceae bacterium]|jgi:hypothetical protein|nr:hypothetical protein [Lacipirellulaceae bacterium]
MAEEPTKIRDVAWNEMFPWLILTRSVRIALLARVMVLGAIGLLATMAGWSLLAEVFSHSSDPVVTNWNQGAGLGLWHNSLHSGLPNPWVVTSAPSAVEVFDAATTGIVRAPISIWVYLTQPFIQMFHGALTATGFLFLLLCGIWELLVWGLVGGAITRIAALKFTRDEAPGMMAALKHAASKWLAYSLPPFIALLGASVFGLQLVVLGFAMRLSIITFLAAITWPFVLLLGLMMAILLLGALAGWPLMWATVSVEGTDAFDALSRSYAYTYHRPWRLLWYVLFATFLAVVSMFVVKLFASSAVTVGDWAIDWGLDDETMHGVVEPRGPQDFEGTPPAIEVVPGTPADKALPPISPRQEPIEPTGLLAAARTAIGFWKTVVAALVAGYQAGFLWVAAVGIYLLLRRDIDGVQLNEVYLDQADEYGLPPLVEDPATGVPAVAPGAPAIPGDVRS